MQNEVLSEIVSSKSRLKIAALLSERPRSLKELAGLTGISVQGVLKHLTKLDALGLLEERKISGAELPLRKVYSIREVRIGDFSLGNLTIVKSSSWVPRVSRTKKPLTELEYLAGNILIQRRRIREQSRRLGRMIDELVEDEIRLSSVIDSLRLGDKERLILQTVFTEEGIDAAEEALTRHQGLVDARRSIRRVLGKVESIAG